MDRRRLILAGGRPSWLLRAAGLTSQIDWNTGRARLNNIDYQNEAVFKAQFNTFSTPACYVTTAAGVLKLMPANSVHGYYGSDRGQLIEEARTNKLTSSQINPPALVGMGAAAAFNSAVTGMTASGGDGNTLWGVVDDSAAMTVLLSNLLANGNVNGRVYKVDNSAGAVTAYLISAGTPGNTNAHSQYTIARATSGTPRIESSSGRGAANIVSSIYSLVKGENFTPVSSSAVTGLTVPAGAVVYFLFMGLEEGAFATSPIAVAGSSVTRAASSIIANDATPLATAAQSAKAMFFQTYGVNGAAAGTNRLFAFVGNASLTMASTTTLGLTNATNTATATIGASGVAADVVKTAVAMDGTSFTVLANGGTKASSANAWAGNTGNLTLGNVVAGNRALNGYLTRSAFSSVKGAFDGLAA